MKINIDQFALDTRWRGMLWQLKRRYPLFFLCNRIEWYFYPILKLVPSFPLHIDFEVSSLCNLRCPMCYRPYRKESDDGLMDFSKYKQGIDECARHGLYSIRLSWRGEPTLHPEIAKMISYAKDKGIKEVSFISNGTSIDEGLARKLIEAGLDYFSVSIDGVGKKYEEIRYPSKFDEAVERLRIMRRLRDSIGRGYPRVRINSIWSAVKEDKHEYYSIFSKTADFITVNPDYDHSLEKTGMKSSHVCQYLYQRLTVMWDGTIPLCISDKSKEIVLGELGKDSLYDIWHGKKLEGIRKMQRAGKTNEIAPCSKCQRSLTAQVGNQRVPGKI